VLGAIFAVIKKIVSAFFKALYAIISILNLQFLLLVGALWLILYLTGATKDNLTVKIFLVVFAVLSVIYAVVITFIKLFGLNKKEKKRGADIVRPQSAKPQEVENDKNQVEEDLPPPQPYQQESDIRKTEEQPKYFRVKQNSNMIMAEYSDRYELFDLSSGTMKKVRTDYK
jgi:predicted membrane protein